MEIVLLLVLIFLVVYFKHDMNRRLDEIGDKTSNLARRIDAMQAQQTEKPKPTVQPPAPPVTPPKPVYIDDVPAPRSDIPERTQQPIPLTPRPTPKPYIPEKSWWEKFKEQNPDLEKFIGENLINKIGILILVLGISYFVKFAIDKDWINETARTGIGVLCGVLVMAFAHRLRKKFAAFSSVLVAGAVSIFYFTIGIAFHDYYLFSQTVAFILMVVITAFSSVISLSYNRMELAILSLTAGFAVPFMVSTGEGGYVVLFSYITILDIGILALAYYRKWNIVTILAFVLTEILYGAWFLQMHLNAAPPYAGAFAFAACFYLIFTLIVIINNVRTKGEFSWLELTMLAVNTFFFYAIGMVILDNYHPELKGAFTALLSVLNLIYAWFLYKKFGLDKKAVYLLIGLTLTFITLAIPVQFEGNYITLFWSAEAVLLMWLAQKSKFESYRLASVAVHLLAIGSLILDWIAYYTGYEALKIIINPAFITGIFTLCTFIAVLRLIALETESVRMSGFTFNPEGYRRYIVWTAVFTGYLVGILEVQHHSFRLIDDAPSANAFPILFHLVFCAVVVFSMQKQKAGGHLVALIAAVNIALFAFTFSLVPFSEHHQYIESGVAQRIALYLHYVYLAITVYFFYALYRCQSAKATGGIFSHPIFIWAAAFLIIYIASSELLLHGLVLSDSPVTLEQIKAYPNYKGTDTAYIAGKLANNQISATTMQFIKSGFPVLWGVIAFLFLIIGIKRQNKTLRIIALTLLGLTIAKLFLYDIRNASETGKIVAFILLGVVILVISFVYQKIKVLVLDDQKPDANHEDS
ncbi:MAG TPA: DUF2339 domain-containing protein [Flavobacterium sp.]|jgi:uncharacterized membrane protein